MLGYEPSPKRSVVRVVDLADAAQTRGLSVAELLAAYPRGIPADDKSLRAMAQEIPIHSDRWPLLMICNSIAEVDHVGAGWRGVLHQAEIATQPSGPRVVNTVHLGTCSVREAHAVDVHRAWREYVQGA